MIPASLRQPLAGPPHILPADWPNRTASHTVEAAGLRWHVQVVGTGPALLLLHGSGGATHSWRGLLPLLAARCTVVAPDLPGHGFTTAPTDRSRISSGGYADAVAALLATLGVTPVAAAGHSAGAVVALRMALDGMLPTTAPIVGINAALVPPVAAYTDWIAPLVAPLARSPLAARLVAFASSESGARRLLDSTGTRLDDRQVRRYAALTETPSHVGAVLTMMANWDLDGVLARLPALGNPLTLVTAADDRWVSAREAVAVARSRVATVRVVELPAGGHLVHEVAPEPVAAAIADAISASGTLDG